MMGKQTAQGTAHETAIRKRAESIGRSARRTAKAGQAHEADVIIDGVEMRPAVFWKNMIVTGGKRKSVHMVVLREEDFWDLMEYDECDYLGWAIQAKSTQRLGVRATLEGLVGWMKI